MTTKYQVFISSTYEDLKSERNQVIKAVLEMGHIPVGMEMFSAADAEQWAVIQRTIDDCDYYAVIVAHRYGSMDGEVSYTEKEYDYASVKGIPSISFIIDDSAAWQETKRDKEHSKHEALIRFKSKLRKRLVSHWTSHEDLYGKFCISFMKLMTGTPRSGWVKASAMVGPEVMKELSRLSSENAQLRTELGDAQHKAQIDADAYKDKLLSTLKANKRRLKFFYFNSHDYEDEIEVSLFRLFRIVAPEAIIETSTANISQLTGILLRPTKSREARSNWPTAANTTRAWIADLVSLELLEPSNKKHPIRDKEEYWTLTKAGRELDSHVRKLVLQGEEPVSPAASPSPQTPQDSNDLPKTL